MQLTSEEIDFATQQLGGLTFGLIHGRVLKSDTNKSPDPFTRILDFQYKCVNHPPHCNGALWQIALLQPSSMVYPPILWLTHFHDGVQAVTAQGKSPGVATVR